MGAATLGGGPSSSVYADDDDHNDDNDDNEDNEDGLVTQISRFAGRLARAA